MSETPRTDAARQDEHDPYMAIASECSKMEKELNAANVEIERLTAKVAQLYEGAEEQKQRIKRLEEAGNELRECASWVGHSYCQYVDQIRRAKAAIEAWDKEAKL